MYRIQWLVAKVDGQPNTIVSAVRWFSGQIINMSCWLTWSNMKAAPSASHLPSTLLLVASFTQPLCPASRLISTHTNPVDHTVTQPMYMIVTNLPCQLHCNPIPCPVGHTTIQTHALSAAPLAPHPTVSWLVVTQTCPISCTATSVTLAWLGHFQ